jgi:aspartyl-tRNA(Asn)/glutamyl-tRNA(Gln) amidotransferase subunit A
MTLWTLSSAAESIRSRRLSPTELVQDCLKKIAESRLNAFTTVCEEEALSSARRSEVTLAHGSILGPLHGVPLAFKDLFYIEGLPTTCGTAVDAYFVAERTATAVARLQAAGAITLGKLNMTELAMSPFGENARRGDVRNPWMASASAGGSSSGSAAAVAASLVLGSVGTDTAGSIRQPAAYCGIVGLKPTYGRISKAGVMPLAWSLDHVGPMTRTVRDAAILLSAMAGHDPYDRSTSTVPPADYVASLDRELPRLRLGIPSDYFWGRTDIELECAVRGVADAYVRLGTELSEIELGDLNAINAVASLITRSEGCAVHDRFAREHPGVLASAIDERLRLGHLVTAYDYLQAQRLRNVLTREFVDRVFSKVDLIVAPVAPSAAPQLSELLEGETDHVLDRMGHLTSATRPFNGLGLPAISVPCGFSTAGLPLAFQLVGRPFDESLLLQAAHRYEQAFDWWKRSPT